ncbi:MAG: flagellar FlbD family protein [Candidatus Hydrogenedentota bacterium]
MIKVTRLNQTEFYVNPHQIEFMEATPDVVISLVSGKKIVIAEKIEEILQRIIEYRRKIGINIADD